MKCFNCTRGASAVFREPGDTGGTWARFYCARHARIRARRQEKEEAEAAARPLDRSRGSPREHDEYKNY